MTVLDSRSAGIGLRRSLLPELDAAGDLSRSIDFFEVAPENWLGVGGRLGKAFRRYTEHYPFIVHGLSLSLGGPDPLDEIFLQRLKGFLDEHANAVDEGRPGDPAQDGKGKVVRLTREMLDPHAADAEVAE